MMSLQIPLKLQKEKKQSFSTRAQIENIAYRLCTKRTQDCLPANAIADISPANALFPHTLLHALKIYHIPLHENACKIPTQKRLHSELACCRGAKRPTEIAPVVSALAGECAALRQSERARVQSFIEFYILTALS
jgi:hypothetical protein